MIRKQTPAVDEPEVKAARTPRRFDRYEVLIKAAAETFRKNGYDGTSLQQIADEVGILKGSLYHYIDTKEDLLFAIIQRNHERIFAENVVWRDLVADPVAAIRSFIEGHMRQSLVNPTYTEVFIRDFRALSPDRAQTILTAQNEYDNEFRGLITAALEAGLLRDTVDPKFAARAVFGMTNWVYYWYRPEGELSAEDVVAKLTDYAMASLLGPTGR